jgi:hypothetical protein
VVAGRRHYKNASRRSVAVQRVPGEPTEPTGMVVVASGRRHRMNKSSVELQVAESVYVFKERHLAHASWSGC